MTITLIHGDCLEEMKKMPDGSVDLVLTDPPYGTTACKWDTVIPFEPMWEQLKRITKKNGAIVLFGSQPFTSVLITSNIQHFKYCWTWDKKLKTGHLNAKKMPMQQIEEVCIFSFGTIEYHPQMVEGKPTHSQGTRSGMRFSDNYGKQTLNYEDKAGSTMKYPGNLISLQKIHPSKCLHPTQKPVALMEYLIKTYTNEGETVLDFTIGSGTTGIACKNLNRNFIGIELDETYFNIAKERIATITNHTNS